MRRAQADTANDDTGAFAHKRSLGQNFLTSDVVPNWLCDAIPLANGETVLEIGPGTGALTKTLLARGLTVVAIEADQRAISVLEDTFSAAIASGQLTIHHGDARHLNLTDLGLRDHHYVTISNIPYYLSGFLLRHLLQSDTQPKALVFLMQKELVQRIARDRKESLLSLSVKAFGDPVYIKTVGKGHFHPMPKVDSAILAVTNISRNRLGSVPPEFFFDCLHAGLGKKRKQLISNLSELIDRSILERYFSQQNIPNTVRGEDLNLSQWIALSNHISLQR